MNEVTIYWMRRKLSHYSEEVIKLVATRFWQWLQKWIHTWVKVCRIVGKLQQIQKSMLVPSPGPEVSGRREERGDLQDRVLMLTSLQLLLKSVQKKRGERGEENSRASCAQPSGVWWLQSWVYELRAQLHWIQLLFAVNLSPVRCWLQAPLLQISPVLPQKAQRGSGRGGPCESAHFGGGETKHRLFQWLTGDARAHR